ncbi:CcdB family protein [Propionivibrio sp.]|uniref:CcdB family protein n=1 Tax=Propionivibrio sp. TaxID=2212460 RepID=UPI002628D5E4|nr:CcdB family protein [Propionivibrio sp.]
MARFGVYKNPDGEGYLLDVQADLLSHFNTRVVIPLLPLSQAPAPAKTLNPVFDVTGTAHVMVTQFLAAVPESLLKTCLSSQDHRRDEIIAALDLLFQGF